MAAAATTRQALRHAQRGRARPGGRALRLPLHARVHGLVRAALHRGRRDRRRRLLRHDARPHPQPGALGAHGAAGARGGRRSLPPARAQGGAGARSRARRRARWPASWASSSWCRWSWTRPRAPTPAGIIDRAQYCKENEVDAINVADGPRASARMSAQSLCVLMQKKVGSTPSSTTPAATGTCSASSRTCWAPTRWACATSWPSPATRPSSATTRTRPRSTTWTPSGSSGSWTTSTTAATWPATPSAPRWASTSAAAPTRASRTGRRRSAGWRRRCKAGAEYIMTQPVYDPRTVERFLGLIKHLERAGAHRHPAPVLAPERRVPAQRGAGDEHPRGHPRAHARGGLGRGGAGRGRAHRPGGAAGRARSWPRAPTSCRPSTRSSWPSASSKRWTSQTVRRVAIL